jgi:hypothetical protein
MEDVELNTIKRKINTAENPKRQSLTTHGKPKNRATVPPTKMNKSHKTQQKRERAAVLLKS